MLWGLGHSSGVILSGSALLLLRGVLPLDQISSWAERSVGIVLIGIGIWALRKALHVHSHEHSHSGPGSHAHIHIHSPQKPHADPASHVHTHAPFAIGTLHGLAGSSHLAGILPALAFPSRGDAINYLAAYCLATVVAMTAFSLLVGLVTRGFSLTGVATYRLLMSCCSLVAFCVGSYWLIL